LALSRVLAASIWITRPTSSWSYCLVCVIVYKRLFVRISTSVLMACKSTYVSSIFSVSSLRRPCIFWWTHDRMSSNHVWWSPLTQTRWSVLTKTLAVSQW
jgi:hypothetical protein